jgi:elongator complex protein 5
LWQILENARARRVGEALAYNAEGEVEVMGDWAADGGAGSSSASGGAIIQVLVRKATGGAKGISRSLEALAQPNRPTSQQTLLPAKSHGGLSVVPLSSLISSNPIIAPAHLPPGGAGQPDADLTHDALGLPFNLSLTDEQRRRRGEVPVPYAHEGEGVELGWEEEEEDDEEI